MSFLSSINIIGSAMTAEHTRLDVISENITNMNTTRTEGGGAYRRKIVTFEAESEKNSFRLAFERARRRQGVIYGGGYASLVRPISNRGYENAGGVRVAEIGEDDTEMPFVYDPGHPDANEAGYVEMPNVVLVKEITDAMAASQAYGASVTAFNTLKGVVSQGLQISI
ncbi:MAG: flagellar basal body rod protein FlgC [Oscillospiraceae bacterium]|nr:flagellar basal body rod protein FlgC [Oscillospiraceae bacterium]